MYEDDQVVAYVMYKETDNPDQLGLTLLAAHPKFRGKHALDLTRKVFEEAIKLKKSKVILNVFTINTRGVNFYRRTVPRELKRLVVKTEEALLEKRKSKVTGGEKQVIQFTYDLNDTLGGIDLNPNELNLQENGQRVNFNMVNTMLQTLNPNSVRGITPVIINITPISNFMPLLGLSDNEDLENQILTRL